MNVIQGAKLECCLVLSLLKTSFASNVVGFTIKCCQSNRLPLPEVNLSGRERLGVELECVDKV